MGMVPILINQDGSRQSPLVIDGLRIDLGGQAAVRDVSIALESHSIHGLVGNSGSGKTLTSLAAVGLLPRGGSASGSIRLAGMEEDLLDIDERTWPSIRGLKIGYVGQNALGCLHPAFRVGWQVVEAIRRHQRMSRRDAHSSMLEQLAAVDLQDPERVARSRPAQLSGTLPQPASAR